MGEGMNKFKVGLHRFNTATFTLAGVGLCALVINGALSLLPHKGETFISFATGGDVEVQRLGTSCEYVREGRALHIYIRRKGNVLEALCVEYDDVKGRVL